MYLKKLEMHGFKSFAHNTPLEFQKGISAIVGPNGSGKSNVADALRFVLGEQSMKNVRSKKMEDLIFSGSHGKSRMSMASVAIHFDNHDKAFPVDFSEVIIKRKVFRDGENQYFINDAHVRLKDLAELIAKAHLGLKGYTIINQGMGDAILSASPKERREIIFEALGLKEYQMKKNESLSKLAQTQTNLTNAQAIVREIEPHLKFLKKQVEKIEERHLLEQKLCEMESQYLHKQVRALERKEHQLQREAEAKHENVDKLQEEIARIEKEIEEHQGGMQNAFGDIAKLEQSLIALEEERNALSREVGKMEGMLALSIQRRPEAVREAAVTMAYVKEKLESLNALLDECRICTTYDALAEKVGLFTAQFSGVLKDIRENKISTGAISKPEQDTSSQSEIEELENKKRELQELLCASDEKIQSAKEEVRKINTAHSVQRENVFELRNKRRDRELALEDTHRRFAAFDREIAEVNTEKEMLNREIEFLKGQGMFFPIDDASVLHTQADEEIRRNIERMKLKLENVDLIDTNIKQEYEDTQKRYDFLTKESEDLTGAISSLQKIIAELDGLITERFKTAFVNINKNFNAYFKTLFQGGTAHLEVVDNTRETEDGEVEVIKDDYGVDVAVSLPKKKISDLAMLSGGERTLTSLALLFALVSTSPPPFLVLDEIDAPLDEANSLRFGDILRELKQHTQFIVITHNRETMRQSDVLYGVTMQEEGVSKLLSLKFDMAQEMVR